MTRVVLIMIDGLRPDAITPASAPFLTGLQTRSAYTLTGRSVMPAVTLPCHVSIFHSVPPERHGITDNTWHSMSRPVVGLVEHLKAHRKLSGFIYNWEPLRDLNRPGNLAYAFFEDTCYVPEGDAVIARIAVEQIAAKRWDFLFVYLGTVDIIGHQKGWMSAGYLEHVRFVDGLIQQIMAAGDAETTFILHSDHGGYERDHGRDIPEDMTIPWFITGAGVRENYQIQQPVSLLDTAPTTAYLLGVPPHPEWEGTVVTEAFISSRGK
ncbi:MAG: alkaline phosphatase family protein [Anaerolineaceae bacterium]|nr:alkaline phosphatase family protein [Anaerolineaceae bacterium]